MTKNMAEFWTPADWLPDSVDLSLLGWALHHLFSSVYFFCLSHIVSFALALFPVSPLCVLPSVSTTYHGLHSHNCISHSPNPSNSILQPPSSFSPSTSPSLPPLLFLSFSDLHPVSSFGSFSLYFFNSMSPPLFNSVSPLSSLKPLSSSHPPGCVIHSISLNLFPSISLALFTTPLSPPHYFLLCFPPKLTFSHCSHFPLSLPFSSLYLSSSSPSLSILLLSISNSQSIHSESPSVSSLLCSPSISLPQFFPLCLPIWL